MFKPNFCSFDGTTLYLRTSELEVSKKFLAKFPDNAELLIKAKLVDVRNPELSVRVVLCLAKLFMNMH